MTALQTCLVLAGGLLAAGAAWCRRAVVAAFGAFLAAIAAALVLWVLAVMLALRGMI